MTVRFSGDSLLEHFRRLDCGHRQASFRGWRACPHPAEVHPWTILRGGFDGSAFLALPLDGDCLCRSCREAWRKFATLRISSLEVAAVRHLCARCALDRLLEAPEVAS